MAGKAAGPTAAVELASLATEEQAAIVIVRHMLRTTGPPGERRCTVAAGAWETLGVAAVAEGLLGCIIARKASGQRSAILVRIFSFEKSLRASITTATCCPARGFAEKTHTL